MAKATSGGLGLRRQMTFNWILPADRFFLLARIGIILLAAAATIALLKMRKPEKDSTCLVLITLSPSLLAFLLLFPVTAVEVLAFISNPVALDYNEGGLMTHVVEAFDGAIYSKLEKIPYEINNYGPVFFYLTAAVSKIFHIEILPRSGPCLRWLSWVAP